ncbi:hypothetical protein [Natronorubrum sulfidifaciens]|uniref:DUF8107 domain-containing protein n=1 Tax=Natronorubrum sulfidifaciens JCM 14089 TaxID=1230460 RepID=L9WDU4_9EURY|nr:hypothetical protein [Natronorubrum sulfidifaciens]ELY47451.1 hypothetical protein C495_04307 [Natronorubrum sulfidifaciens JCM 14089]
MTESDADRDGFREGLESSRGDPRVLAVLNALFSVLFAVMIVQGASLIGALEYRMTTVAGVAVGLFVLTYVMARR